MGKKHDLSDCECGVVVETRWAGLSSSENADLLRFSSRAILGYRQLFEKEKIPSYVDINALLVPKVRREGPHLWVFNL